ncbi:MAG: hypothetical protein MJ187_02775, partial [Alphaproteobacteria bacterium]|nr:hypothetical protein [Alphaproteobacteria bacterium]
SAYSNTLSQRKTASAQKLQAAQRALREEALEQIQNANKYDLGQCVIEFSKCMQTTAGCGADYTACTSMSVMDNVNSQKSTSAGVKNYQIKGAITNIEITASTYDALMSKKPLCETVTKQCTRVAGQVWDTFLQNVAPQLKSAELIAEDNARQNCIGTISDCFKKACKDNMDPNDPDGSYDMCLSRPETMLNVCKIPLNNCGIDSSNAANAQKSNVWGFVVARLASMRVDSCTTEVKQCLISDDRCGTDYLNCIGLDTDTIIRMCPYDKLVGCQKVYGDTDITGDKVYEELSTMVQGLMLNIDNNMLTQCQKAANDAMIKVCGDTENCNGLTVEENMGARSLEYRICEYSNNDGKAEIAYNSCRNDVSQITDGELGRVNGMVGNAQTTLGPITPLAGVLDGTIYWESLKVNDDGRLSSVEEYLATINETSATSDQKHRLSSEISMLQSNIDSAINAIESDPTVQFCMTGREVQGMKINNERKNIGGTGADNARFPELTKQMRLIIANAALKKAKDNYYKKYDELNAKMLQDYTTIGERIAEIQGENSKDARRELGRQACIAFADASALPKSPNPPKNVFGKVLVVTAVAVASVFTAGAAAGVAAGVAAGATAGVAATAGAGASLAVGGALSATAGLAATAGSVAVATGLGIAASGSNNANGSDGKFKLDLIGSKQVNQWNYKESITSTYDWETLNCHRCIRSQKCSTTKNPLFGKKYCKKWAESVENCTDTQF